MSKTVSKLNMNTYIQLWLKQTQNMESVLSVCCRRGSVLNNIMSQKVCTVLLSPIPRVIVEGQNVKGQGHVIHEMPHNWWTDRQYDLQTSLQ